MSDARPILVTGAAGSVGAVGRTVVEILRRHDLPVRALVRREDDRAQALRAMGAEVVVGDLTRGADVAPAMAGCRRVYFGMSVSAAYVDATVTAAAAAREQGDVEVLVNISQMTVSQMNLTSTAESTQQRLHWLAEQVLDWSGLPVVHLRPTVFMENPLFMTFAVSSIAKDGTIRLPFGSGRTSPVAAGDVAHVAATVLAYPFPHIGKVYELTGPRSQDMNAMAAEFSEALGRPVTYVDVPYRQWVDRELSALGLPDHVFEHLATMARLHSEGRYDRATRDIEKITGRPASSVRDFVAAHPALFPR
ncbi:NAD(P)H-binding protein [Microtetraspora sp. NBRC 16547]|uniref:NAD(P)H-binding protein n=1 Tax=Microtetraspora sp. NBRC 16547 TaxID=3030993 RepID=UPI0024A00C97|nr:NAD(P)H-binding protein [Microtetraspora sp. NBRC 16547]GLX02004.1 NAD(P)-dependent oxidoreductase [Microtetraspora sp. NBRC 16547]